MDKFFIILLVYDERKYTFTVGTVLSNKKGMEKGKLVFVGVRGFGVGDLDLRVATSLKVLCEELGVSYSMVRRKGTVEDGFWDKGAWLPGENGKSVRNELGVAWWVRRVALSKIEGRGRSKGTPFRKVNS